MQALMFHRPKDVRVEQVPEPRIEDSRDAIVRVSAAAICGADLLIYNGSLPQEHPLILGHEVMGTVVDHGPDVHGLEPGDRVVIPAVIACGECWFCTHGLVTHCARANPETFGPEGGLVRGRAGGVFGSSDPHRGYDGGQAQYLRVPFADFGPRKIPDDVTDAQALLLSEIAPVAWSALEAAQLSGGETVVVFGCGATGLVVQKMAWLFGAERVIGIDVLPYRLEMARRIAHAATINAREQDVAPRIRELTDGRGADVCVDAVGMYADRNLRERLANVLHLQHSHIPALRMACDAVRRGGSVIVLGTYAAECDDFPLGQIMDKGIKLRAGATPSHHALDALIPLLQDKKLRLDDVITHVIPLAEAPRAYEIFHKKLDRCVKVVLKPQ